MSRPSPRPAHGRRRLIRLVRTAAFGSVLVAGVCWWSVGEDSDGAAAPAAAVNADHKPGGAAPAPLGRSTATLLALPGITVEASIVPLPRAATAPPADPEAVGWYANGPSPGEPGTAVVVGHGGPGVLHGLGALQRGNTVRVSRADGLTAVFTVDEVRTHTTPAVPHEEPTRTAPRVRVIALDPDHAVDVYGHLTEVTRNG